MKVNLSLYGSNEPLAGYINIDVVNNKENKYVIGNVSNLDDIVDDGEAEEIRAINILQYFSSNDSERILRNWLSKLAHKGKAIIGFTDISAVCRDIYLEKLDIHQANAVLYGQQKDNWDYIKNGFAINHLAYFISTLGYKILGKRVLEYQGILTVERT